MDPLLPRYPISSERKLTHPEPMACISAPKAQHSSQGCRGNIQGSQDASAESANHSRGIEAPFQRWFTRDWSS
jgi:hypothetical protein